MRILAGLETQKFGGGGCSRQCPGRVPVPAPRRVADSHGLIPLAIDPDTLSSALPYAGERIFMLQHDMWGSAFGPGAGLSTVFGPQNGGYAGFCR
jgi:hypothetical protein